MQLAFRQAVVRVLDEHTVGAGVLQQITAVAKMDTRVMSGDIGVRNDPIVIGRTSDAPACCLEYLTRSSAQLTCLRTDDIKRECHCCTTSRIGTRILLDTGAQVGSLSHEYA